MKKFSAVLVLVLLASIFAVGQDAGSVFGGYQYSNLGMAGERTSVPKGWDFDATARVASHTSVVADFTGAYKDGGRIHTFMFGPRFSAARGKVTPFAEALFGGARGFGEAKFSMALGGGLDVNAGKNVAIRLAKFDYNFVKIEGANMNNLRFATGIVFKF